MEVTKKTFIDLISEYDPKEINDFIKSKGKPPKLFSPIIFIGKDKSTSKE